MKLDKIRALLAELSVLFIMDGQEDSILRARILRKFYNRTFEYEGENYDPYFIRELQNLHGGNGSFFDTYIGDDSSPDFRNPESKMYKARKRFDILENQLSEECDNLRAKKYTKNPHSKWQK
jgi:hypothetical protein